MFIIWELVVVLVVFEVFIDLGWEGGFLGKFGYCYDKKGEWLLNC